MNLCKKKANGRYIYKGYEIANIGYYPPDKCIWWEATDLTTMCADFHAHTKRHIIKLIDDYKK